MIATSTAATPDAADPRAVFDDEDLVAMRRAIESGPHRMTAVGIVFGRGHTADHGIPYIKVNWLGADGGPDAHHPDLLVRVAYDSSGVPRAI
ncbi:hypothetical protein [Planotetraspora sp. GP83]|uniref:hypothetical protein n=1 Tax=Planotetraspora sp. GP83 TaxID=3156264 RepID=UPI003510FAB4